MKHDLIKLSIHDNLNKLIHHLEKRVSEQEQLITLLNEKLSTLEAHEPGINANQLTGLCAIFLFNLYITREGTTTGRSNLHTRK